MSHKIIKPEGIELIEYLNNGYAICNRCGAVMRQTEDPKTGFQNQKAGCILSNITQELKDGIVLKLIRLYSIRRIIPTKSCSNLRGE